VTGRRVAAASGIALAVATGLFVHTALPGSAASDIAGDALYASAAHLLVVLVLPRWSPVATGAAATAWCVGVELFQLTGLPERWGAMCAPVMLVLGTVFDPRDLIVYVVTIALMVSLETVVRVGRRGGEGV